MIGLLFLSRQVEDMLAIKQRDGWGVTSMSGRLYAWWHVRDVWSVGIGYRHLGDRTSEHT
jgi:hypothetical protein